MSDSKFSLKRELNTTKTVDGHFTKTIGGYFLSLQKLKSLGFDLDEKNIQSENDIYEIIKKANSIK